MIDHAVLAKGYGSETRNIHDPTPTNPGRVRVETKKYWLIQNSWGPGWGEDGHIRLKRADNEEEVIHTDPDTSMGLGCEGDPVTVEVRGACGILFDAVKPEGVTLTSTARSTALTMV